MKLCQGRSANTNKLDQGRIIDYSLKCLWCALENNERGDVTFEKKVEISGTYLHAGTYIYMLHCRPIVSGEVIRAAGGRLA